MNASDKLSEADKFDLQQYITRCYESSLNCSTDRVITPVMLREKIAPSTIATMKMAKRNQ